jgi:hypothetical protein
VLEQAWDTSRLLVGPAFGAALAVTLLLRLVGRERLAPLAAALGVAAGVLLANHLKPLLSYQLDNDRPLTADDLHTVLGWSLEGKPPVADDAPPPPPNAPEPPPVPKSEYWLLWAAALAVLVDLLARVRLPSAVGWTARALVAVFAARLLTPPSLRLENPWMMWLLGGTMLALWATLTGLAHKRKDGVPAAALALCCAAAGVVALDAASAKYMDLNLCFFAALLGVACVAWLLPGDTGPALAGAAVFLPGVLLLARYLAPEENKVPTESFVLAGLAPLGLLPLFLPIMGRQQGWKRWLPGLLLPLVPAAAAVVLALLAQPLELDSLQ